MRLSENGKREIDCGHYRSRDGQYLKQIGL